MNKKVKFSILITTKNRLEDLKVTLHELKNLMLLEEVECLIYDDASNDGTFDYVKENFPKIILFRNNVSLGLIHNRNVLLNKCSGDYAISLDDDSNFISENILEKIKKYFEQNSKCGVIACRIFWSKTEPIQKITKEKEQIVQGFVGCGHVWNLKAWKDIPDYPEWFVFYGEEDFAAYHLFLKGWQVHYVPQLLVHHRVDNKNRKKNKDYTIRLRRSLRSGWYLYFMFLPWDLGLKKIGYSIYCQLRFKVLKGDVDALKALLGSVLDLLWNFKRIIKNRTSYTLAQYREFCNLPHTKIYWKPNDE